MATLTQSVSIADLKRAIEARDSRSLARFYADDAVLQVIDHNNPPSRPREYCGRAAITAYHDYVCLRDMVHTVEAGVTEGNRLAFTQRCVYRSGMNVYCATMIELRDGKIARQTVVQAWDE